MRKVYKYTLALQDEQTLMLPKDASILSIQMQGEGEAPQLWALVEPQKPKAPRKIRVYGTGHEIEDGPPGVRWNVPDAGRRAGGPCFRGARTNVINRRSRRSCW